MCLHSFSHLLKILELVTAALGRRLEVKGVRGSELYDPGCHDFEQDFMLLLIHMAAL